MTGTEIRVAAQLSLGVTIDSAVALNYTNEAVEKIVDEFKDLAGKLATKSVTVASSDAYYELDADMVKIVNILNSNNERMDSDEYSLEDDTIRIDYADTYTVKYRKYPDAISAEDSTPDIPRQFHRAIGEYVAYKEALRLYGSRNSDTNDSLDRFWAEAKRGARVIESKKRRRIKAHFND